MTFIDENTDRRTLEIAAIFECDIDTATVEAATDDELRAMIAAWIEEASEV